MFGHSNKFSRKLHKNSFEPVAVFTNLRKNQITTNSILASSSVSLWSKTSHKLESLSILLQNKTQVALQKYRLSTLYQKVKPWSLKNETHCIFEFFLPYALLLTCEHELLQRSLVKCQMPAQNLVEFFYDEVQALKIVKNIKNQR